MNESWRWAGARSRGTSHLKTGTVCQDYAGAMHVTSSDGPTMIAVVSDGAGSAVRADIGSKIVCLYFLRACKRFLARHPFSSLTEEIVWDWIDGIREAINFKAEAEGLRPRDFAATLVAVIITPAFSTVIHIGDGAAVLKRSGADFWEVPSWPYQGEYASTTSFVTDDPQPRLTVVFVDDVVDEFALFSDGIERMVLDQAVKAAHAPFFNRMLAPLKASDGVGNNEALSAALQSYLDGPSVCDRTDDDKTLILGVRI